MDNNPPTPNADAPAAPTTAQIQEQLKTEGQFKMGANTFFWIAGFSLVNSIILTSGGQWSFFIGIGITQLIDGIALGVIQRGVGGAETAVRVVALLLDVIVAGVLVGLGIFARKKYSWAFIVGMILYGLDGLIFLLVQDFLSLGFHALVLFWLFSGFKALSKMQKAQLTPPSPPSTGITNQ